MSTARWYAFPMQYTSNSRTLMTRRRFLYGAAGLGALAVAAGAGFTLSTNNSALADEGDEEEITILEVPTNAVFTLDDCTEIPATECVSQIGTFELPYGTLVWANSDSIAACLLPTEAANPLTQVGILFLDSGACPVVLPAAISQTEGFEIYDVRACEAGLIWAEANILGGVWRIYTATLNGEAIGEAKLVEEGNTAEWETPSLAAVGSHAFWQILPNLDGEMATENSTLKRASFGQDNSETVITSEGRFCTPPYALADSLVVTPRANLSGVYYQLTLLDEKSSQPKDKLVLPKSMKPLEAGWGTSGFSFSFEGIYNYGDGIANLGTYTPQSVPAAEAYEGLTWFRFGKTPSAAPSWCGNLFVVKSTRSVCGVDLANKTYFAIDVDSGSDTYGDYLASTGVNGTFVTYANIHNTDIENNETKICRVKVWAPLS